MKLLGTLATAALSLALATSAFAQEFPAGSTMERLNKDGKVRIGVKFDQPLFGLRNLRGQPEGFDVEIGKIVAAKLGIKPENITWVETVSANREAFITQKKVDMVIATYAITPKRKDVVTFAGPYILTGQDLLLKKGNPEKILGPEDLKGKKVCVVNGSENRNNMVNTYPDVPLVGFDAFSKCAEAVKNGSVSAATLSGAVILGFVSKEPEAFEIMGKPFTVEPWGVGVTKGDVTFCEFVGDAIKEAAADGRYETAYKATVGKFTTTPAQLPKFDACS